MKEKNDLQHRRYKEIAKLNYAMEDITKKAAQQITDIYIKTGSTGSGQYKESSRVCTSKI